VEFNNKQAIFLQIADLVCDNILSGKFPAGDRIASIRELAVSLAVNPNTVMRTYEYLQQQGVIFNKRGMGYYVDDTAPEIIRSIRQQKLFEQNLPKFVKEIKKLGLDFDVVMKNFEVLYNKE